MNELNKIIPPEDQKAIIFLLKSRFENNMQRHPQLEWKKIQIKLETNNNKLWSLYEMERTGGEPDVVGFDAEKNEFIFFDCSTESPSKRRSLCYDRQALESRKENKPANNALDFAASMGIELLSEKQYRQLQQLGVFDAKTSSWVQTPDEILQKGGAIFCDYRYGQVFVYHNGAESYYASRGFRGSLAI